MKTTIETNRLRLFLGNHKAYSDYAAMLYDMAYSEEKREKSDACHMGCSALMEQINQRVEAIRARGGLLHLGAFQ